MSSDELSVYFFKQDDGEEVILASSHLKDRQWLEQEQPEGFTPWMHLVKNVPLDKLSAWSAYPKVLGMPIEGRGRVNMDHVTKVTHMRAPVTDGWLPE